MADKKISQFTALAEAAIDAANDVLPVVDATGPETKKATVSAIVGAGAAAGVGEISVDNITINGNSITSTDTNGNINLTPDGTGEVNISKVDIDAGAIDGTIIGGASAAAGTFTNLTASGTVSFSGATVSNGGSVTTVDINGGTIDGVNIGGASPSVGTFTTLSDSLGNVRTIPQSGSAKTGSYTLAVTDVGQFIEVGSGGSITVPDATFAAGDVVSIFNNTTGTVTLTMSITTAYIGGADVDEATIDLATRGVATILFISGTVCVVNGNVS